MNFYDVLGVQPDASEKEIGKAFRAVSRTCAPDLFPGEPDKEELFKKLTEAHDTLRDPAKRLEYDGKIRLQSRTQQSERPKPKTDKSTDASSRETSLKVKKASVTVTLKQWIQGCKVNSMTYVLTVPKCSKSEIDFNIYRDNLTIRLTVKVKQHHLFRVEDRNLLMTLPVTPLEALLGAKLKIQDVFGKPFEVSVPKGSPNRRRITLQGLGLPETTSPSGKRVPQGALIVTLKIIKYPTTANFGELLQAEAKLVGTSFRKLT